LRISAVNGFSERYDWVFNAKRKLPSLKMTAAIEEFENLILRVAQAESKGREQVPNVTGTT